jgi:hypothetical protein
MKKLVLAATVGLAMMTGVAVAQTTTSQTTTTVTPAPDVPMIAAPPSGTLSITREQKTTAFDGTKTDKTETTYRNTNGVADDTTTKTTTYPTTAVTTTTTKSSSTVTE